MPVTCLTTMLTMCPSSGLGTKPIVGFCLRLGQLLSTCVSFSLGASEDTLKWNIITCCMFAWFFCFTVTLTIFIGEFCGLRSRIPFFWDGFLCAQAFYFPIFCLSTSIILGTTYIRFLPPGSTGNWVISATAFAFVAAVLYALEAFCIISSLEAWSGSSQPSQACSGGQRTMLTGSSSPSSAAPTSISISEPYIRGGGPRMLLPGRSCELHSERLHQFNKKLDGQPQRSSDVSCSNRRTCSVCAWDQRLAVAVLSSCCLMWPTLSTWPARLL
ncbi:myeloid-associated differentiation marker-like [Oryx dammah]|uniref:myeloid-associated differentiation marker-like n=1 Tax=Oryx dammah TaxID=59534 RepID=UPI001A9B9153|nr:myeloid-associated differentiation marker-like [Oryx dammah]